MDIDPFMSARDALQGLPEVCDEKKTEKEQDILYTCHKLCWEVINLAGSGESVLWLSLFLCSSLHLSLCLSLSLSFLSLSLSLSLSLYFRLYV